jgi:PAS domain S-box-containing protein
MRDSVELDRQKLHLVFMQAPVAICIIEGPRHLFILANPAYRALVGGRDVVGKFLLDALPELAGQGFDTLLDRVMASGEPFVGDEVLIKLDRTGTGQTIEAFLNFVYSPKRNAEGQIDGVLVSAFDVTEQVRARRRAELLADQLRESEERLRRVVDASGTGTWELDLATGIVTADARHRFLRGYSPDGPLTLASGLDGIDQADRERVAQAIGAARAGENGGRFHVEFRVAKPSAPSHRWVEVRGQVLFDGAGQPTRFVGTSVDASDRKDAEAQREQLLDALQRSEEGFRAVAEAIPQQVWTATPQGALDFVNQRAQDYFAASREHVLGAGWQAVIHPDDLSQCVQRWTRSLETGDEYEVEFRLRRSDGAYRWHLARALALRDGTGQIVKWFGTNTDFDEAKKTREELKQRTDFEQHLMGIVSHDLRNPLNVILLGAMSLARRTDLGDAAARTMVRIQSAAERATRMIRDLPDFTQARQGAGIHISPRPIDLREVLRAELDELAAAHPERELRVRHGGDGRGNWDSDRIGQVVQNLVSNALKYSPPATPVEIVTEGQHDEVQQDEVQQDDGQEAGREARWVTLSVHNQGQPIPAEMQSRIFEPLQRASLDTDKTARSIGLGLYIVKRIVDAHGGTVEVRSAAGQGTTFIVRLPRGLP